ncbi:MAG: hypothetical protein IJ250_01525 [Bacteroidales bacterium]|nr:hypothetical protein [Bacteroidales bacterium]
MHTLVSKYAALLLMLLGFTGCNDDFDEWGYVNFYIEPDSTEYYNLNISNRKWEYMHGGNRGIIIVRNSYYEFMAYERSCVLKNCKGVLEADTTNNVLIFCPQCQSQWLAVDGSPLDGSKAKRMLYAYCTYYDGWKLYVNNCNR